MITLGEGELGFTFCGTPVIYGSGNSATISIEWKSGEKIRLENTRSLDRKHSDLIFSRTGSVRLIRVELQGIP